MKATSRSGSRILGSAVYLAMGLWLLSVPFVFAHDEAAAASDRVVGLLAVIVGLAAFRYPRVIAAGLLLSAYLVAMPFLLGYEGTAHQVHDIVLGAASGVVALAVSATGVRRRPVSV